MAANDIGVGEWVRRGVDRHPGLGHPSAMCARHHQMDPVGDDVG
jgi:hypothetical protein